MNQCASIIVLNWNGKHLLAESLPAVIKAVEFDEKDHEIIVVDNGSTDGSVEFVKAIYPAIKVVALPKNMRFTGGNNAGVASSKYDIVVFLNNDVIPREDFLPPLLKHFENEDKNLFAVTCQIFMPPEKKREETGITRGKFERGFVWLRHEQIKYQEPVPVLYFGGASSAVNKKKFMELGGFDTLYDPFYLEDTDLAYRAWKRSWKSIYEPDSIVYHKHQATNRRRFGTKVIRMAKERNKYLFIWKNVTDKRYLLSHLFWLPLILSFSLVKLDFIGFLSFFRALKRLPLALQGRKREKEYLKCSDKKILEITSHPLRDQKEDRRLQKLNKGGRLNILFLSPYLPVQGIHGGGGRMFSLIRELSRKHNIYVLSFVTKKELAYIAALKKYCREVKTVLRKPYPGLNASSLIPSQTREYYSPAIHQEIKDFLKMHKIDIISAEYILMSNYLVENYKSTLTLHQLNFLSNYRDWKRKNPLDKAFTFLPILKMLNYEIKTSQKYHQIIMLTEYEKRILNLFSPRLKVEVIPMGADKEYFSPRRIKESNDLIYIGYFLHSPNVDAMLYFCKSIYPLIKKELPKTRLQIIGYQPPPKIQALAQDKSITVTGHVKDLRPYLAKSKLFINPIRLGAGMRGKVLEAWAMAKPVVSTSIGCQGLEVITGRHLFIADRPEVFASQTVKLLKDKKLRLKMGLAGRRLVESKYNWEVIARKLKGIYQELVLEVSEFQ